MLGEVLRNARLTANVSQEKLALRRKLTALTSASWRTVVSRRPLTRFSELLMHLASQHLRFLRALRSCASARQRVGSGAVFRCIQNGFGETLPEISCPLAVPPTLISWGIRRRSRIGEALHSRSSFAKIAIREQ